MHYDMKKLIQYLPMLLLGWCVGCAEDPAIKEIEPLTMDYELPQGKSEADDYIVDMYDKYRTYIVYEYTDNDVYYDEGIKQSLVDFQLPDPKYVESMMDFLDQIWFKIYPEKFHQQTLPYQIFLAKEVDDVRSGEVISTRFVYNGDYSFIIGECNENLGRLTQEEMKTYKNTLQVAFWDYLNQQNRIDFPDEFFEISDYSKVASREDETSPDYARARGFVEGDLQLSYDWYTYAYYPTYTINKSQDLMSFITWLLTRSSEEWEEDLTWPLVKKKYDILRNWTQEEFGFDIQSIGNLFCE